MDKAFLKGLNVLEIMALSEQPRGITDLADELGMTKSNVHRVLQTLIQQGYVSQAAVRGQYQCSLKLWELGSAISERVSVKSVAPPYMREVAEASKETVHLSILDGSEVVYIDKIDSPQPVRAYTRVGGRAPAYAVATGKALLAYLTDAEVDALDLDIQPHTKRTLRGMEELRRALATVRQNSYAINREEWRESVCGLACPIFDSGRTAIAAIGISGPTERLSAAKLRDYAPLVQNAATAISRALGYRGTLPTG